MWHLSISNVAVDDLSYPTKLQIRIKGSKMDQWWQGADLIVGHTSSHICPVKSLLAYMAVQGFHEGPLFLNRNRLPFTQQSLISSLHSTLT